MDDLFKTEPFLVLAFTAVGFASIANTFWEKITCVAIAAVLVIARALVKKYLQ